MAAGERVRCKSCDTKFMTYSAMEKHEGTQKHKELSALHNSMFSEEDFMAGKPFDWEAFYKEARRLYGYELGEAA